MKLFVWCEPYSVAYGSSMVIAVAEDVAMARTIAANSPHYSYGQYGGEVRDWSNVVLGEPNRVVDLPCAEWHEWSE